MSELRYADENWQQQIQQMHERERERIRKSAEWAKQNEERIKADKQAADEAGKKKLAEVKVKGENAEIAGKLEQALLEERVSGMEAGIMAELSLQYGSIEDVVAAVNLLRSASNAASRPGGSGRVPEGLYYDSDGLVQGFTTTVTEVTPAAMGDAPIGTPPAGTTQEQAPRNFVRRATPQYLSATAEIDPNSGEVVVAGTRIKVGEITQALTIGGAAQSAIDVNTPIRESTPWKLTMANLMNGVESMRRPGSIQPQLPPDSPVEIRRTPPPPSAGRL